MRKTLLVTSAALLLTAAPCALAAEPMTMEQMQMQLEALSKQVEKLSTVVEEQNRLIRKQTANLESQDAKLAEQAEKLGKQSSVVETLAAIKPAAGEEKKDAVKITMKSAPKIESADGKYSFQPLGRVHLDYTYFADDVRDNPNNVHFRRARIGAKGDLGEDFNYKFEMDFSGDAANILETYIAYTGMDFAELWLGNFKPPVGLEQNTSTNYMEFIENAPVTNAFTRGEIIGAALKGGGDNWSLAGGLFNEDPGTNTADEEAWSVDARASVDLLKDSPDVIHLGLGGSFRAPNAAAETVTLAVRSAGTGANTVSTGAIANVDHAFVYAAELAGVFGPFSAQGEYMHYEIDRDAVATEPEFDGWYAQASYFLTGESRPYKGKTGSFDRIKPKEPFSLKNGGSGAWEILARYDTLDLNDAGAGVLGGETDNMTLGVNWYLTDYIRMMANYVSVDTDNNAVSPNDDPDIVTLRAQWDF